jgi:uncharacterized protein with PQ loop repeat
MDGLIHRHHHKRKEGAESRAPIVSKRWVTVLDRVTLVAGIIGPLTVIPQIFDIYYYHNAAGVSVTSWFAPGVLDIAFLLYGIIHRDKPITVTYSLWLFANFAVAIGAIIYR